MKRIQAIKSRREAQTEFGKLYWILELMFGPPELKGETLICAFRGALPNVVNFIIILLTAAIHALSASFICFFQLSHPPMPGLPDVNLTARLLPVPRASRRLGRGN